jgi:hypothetical protein
MLAGRPCGAGVQMRGWRRACDVEGGGDEEETVGKVHQLARMALEQAGGWWIGSAPDQKTDEKAKSALRTRTGSPS